MPFNMPTIDPSEMVRPEANPLGTEVTGGDRSPSLSTSKRSENFGAAFFCVFPFIQLEFHRIRQGITGDDVTKIDVTIFMISMISMKNFTQVPIS